MKNVRELSILIVFLASSIALISSCKSHERLAFENRYDDFGYLKFNIVFSSDSLRFIQTTYWSSSMKKGSIEIKGNCEFKGDMIFLKYYADSTKRGSFLNICNNLNEPCFDTLMHSNDSITSRNKQITLYRRK